MVSCGLCWGGHGAILGDADVWRECADGGPAAFGKVGFLFLADLLFPGGAGAVEVGEWDEPIAGGEAGQEMLGYLAGAGSDFGGVQEANFLAAGGIFAVDFSGCKGDTGAEIEGQAGFDGQGEGILEFDFDVGRKGRGDGGFCAHGAEAVGDEEMGDRKQNRPQKSVSLTIGQAAYGPSPVTVTGGRARHRPALAEMCGSAFW